MSEKRFINVNHEIWQDGEVWCIAGSEHCADVIATALNEQHETIQDVNTKKEDVEYELLHLKEKYEELLEENQQLKISLTDILETVLQNDFYRKLMKKAIKELSEEGLDIEEMV